jgi:hypothetical protein
MLLDSPLPTGSAFTPGDRMTLQQLAKHAVQMRDASAAARVADVLRFRFGMTYSESSAWFTRITGATEDVWADLMLEADSLLRR